MSRRDLLEAVALLKRLLAALLTAGDGSSEAGAYLREAVGTLSAGAESRIRSWEFGGDLAACFQAATAAGASYSSMGRVAAIAEAAQPVGNSASAIRVMFVRLALTEQATVIARTKFASRTQIDGLVSDVNKTFGAAEDLAADTGAQQAYRTLVGLHAALVRDLNARGRPLPRIITTAGFAPSIVIANRLYGDADRADEITAENGLMHPLFAPATVRALSA